MVTRTSVSGRPARFSTRTADPVFSTTMSMVCPEVATALVSEGEAHAVRARIARLAIERGTRARRNDGAMAALLGSGLWLQPYARYGWICKGVGTLSRVGDVRGVPD